MNDNITISVDLAARLYAAACAAADVFESSDDEGAFVKFLDAEMAAAQLADALESKGAYSFAAEARDAFGQPRDFSVVAFRDEETGAVISLNDDVLSFFSE